jgi:hypothetical protein
MQLPECKRPCSSCRSLDVYNFNKYFTKIQINIFIILNCIIPNNNFSVLGGLVT